MKKIALFTSLWFLLLSCGDRTGTSNDNEVSSIDLRGKTFDAFFDGDISDNSDARAQFIFGQDTTLTLRVLKNSAMTQRTFRWQFVDDSLLVDGVGTAPEMSAVVRESNGRYLLKGKSSQVLLTESK